MTKLILPSLNPQLVTSDLEEIHTNATRVLEEIGIHTSCQQVFEKISGIPRVKIQSDRVYFTRELVEELLELHKQNQKKVVNPLPVQLTLRPYDYASYIVDPVTDSIRPMTQSDLLDMTRLVDALYSSGYPIRGGCPGFAQDMDETLRTINQVRLSAEYSQTGRETDLLTIFEAEYIYRMHAIMGWLPLHFNLFILSPLRVDDASLERILHFLDADADLRIGISAMPLLGATTPLALQDALSQSVAEILGGFTMMKLIAEDKATNFSVKLFPFDMRYSNISLGSAEEALLTVYCKEITEYYQGGAGPNSYIFSTGKLPGQQTASEKIAQALYKGLAGIHTLTCGGATASTVFSPEQLIFDCEIVSYVNRILRGFSFSGDPLDIQMINAGVLENSYLGDENTVRGYRSTYWSPKIFDHSPYQTWRERPTDQRRAVKNMIRELIDAHHYELDKDRYQQIEALFLDAEVSLHTK